MLLHHAIIDFRRLQFTLFHLLGKSSAGLTDITTPTVAQADVQQQTCAGRRSLLELGDGCLNIRRQGRCIGHEEAHTNVVPQSVVLEARDFGEEEPHHRRHLLRISLPILGRECENCKKLDTELHAPEQELPKLLTACTMPAKRIAVHLPAEAPVSIHDHSHMSGPLKSLPTALVGLLPQSFKTGLLLAVLAYGPESCQQSPAAPCRADGTQGSAQGRVQATNRTSAWATAVTNVLSTSPAADFHGHAPRVNGLCQPRSPC
mmetsp:Transcript_66378/g.155566  ORF Transcript_66378/g.155566 Transcript_66378/m.155566 type:complete len:261 (-) Transcript_66378:22-804(-)